MPPADPDPQLERLLEYLRAERGFDLTGYKRPSLYRRIERRMNDVDVRSLSDYHDYLEVHPEEFPLLFDTVLIKVTEFFRDRAAWDFLAQEVWPQILAAVPGDQPLRVWSAGCASGEEAYTLAIQLIELLGEDAFRERVKIYATDIDEESLIKARSGTYSARHLEHMDPGYRERYFEAVGGSYVFRPDLRRMLIFGRHDLTSDAPISRLDLLCCRNTLIYFNAELQSRVVSRFHYALNDGGFLFLGKAETLLSHHTQFQPVDTRFRVFAKVPSPTRRHIDIADEALTGLPVGLGESPIISHAAAASPVAQLVIDVNGYLVAANSVARAQYGITANDIGRLFHDLPISYRPVELRSIIEATYAQGAPRGRSGVARELDGGETQYLDISVVPLFDDDRTPLGVSIAFVDATETVNLRRDLERSREELQSANEELQSTNEELETSNEELQSTNEELETTNEELQSTNEELETTNEELHSTNAELATMNEQLQQRTLQLDRSNLLLDSVIDGMSAGVIVVDARLVVEVWNRAAQELFGLAADEVVGHSFDGLDIGLPVGELVAPVEKVIVGGRQELTVDAVDRRGRTIRCRVRVSPLLLDQRAMHGAVLLLTTDAEQ